MDIRDCEIVELSHELHPGEEEYHLTVLNRYVDDMLPGYPRPPDAWYIMSEVAMWSHVGTHLEAPFHYLKDGADCASVPLKRVAGDAVLVDFTDKDVGEPITAAELEARGGGIRGGDIVFVRTGRSGAYRTPQSHDRPYFTRDAVAWLVRRPIACLGADCSGIEKRDEPVQVCHELLFKNGIPLIEHLAHLERLRVERFFVVAVPWRVRGLEACPISVVAFVAHGEGA